LSSKLVILSSDVERDEVFCANKETAPVHSLCYNGEIFEYNLDGGRFICAKDCFSQYVMFLYDKRLDTEGALSVDGIRKAVESDIVRLLDSLDERGEVL